MTAHVVVSQLDPSAPATLSRKVLSLLRQELGYDGLVFSDDLEMAAIADHQRPAEAAGRALEAGCDVLLACRRPDVRDELLAALERLPDARLEPAARRLSAFKARYAGGRAASEAAPPYRQHAQLCQRLSAEGDGTGGASRA
jgi:beta-N-acetylhexosaminidase